MDTYEAPQLSTPPSPPVSPSTPIAAPENYYYSNTSDLQVAPKGYVAHSTNDHSLSSSISAPTLLRVPSSTTSPPETAALAASNTNNMDCRQDDCLSTSKNAELLANRNVGNASSAESPLVRSHDAQPIPPLLLSSSHSAPVLTRRQTYNLWRVFISEDFISDDWVTLYSVIFMVQYFTYFVWISIRLIHWSLMLITLDLSSNHSLAIG